MMKGIENDRGIGAGDQPTEAVRRRMKSERSGKAPVGKDGGGAERYGVGVGKAKGVGEDPRHWKAMNREVGVR